MTENKKRGVVYIENRYDELEDTFQNLLKDNAVVAVIWVADYDEETIWGDDWNDAPAYCNASPPYESSLQNLEKIEVKLGDISTLKRFIARLKTKWNHA